ncbi:hypothetical protein BH10ACT7_BH10ACT7_30630 [soil metagenome]
MGAGAVIAILLALIINVGAIVGIGWVLANAQRVEDQVAVWQFEPSSALEKYVQRAGLSDEGEFLFFASRPVIASGEEFDNACAARTEGVGILGCYRPSDRSIVLFDVTDDRLAGIEEVVAAHEMLHAAWDRMSAVERAALDPLLEAEAAKLADDPAFAETLAFYAETEPGERLNELHSIIGTEFAEVSPELEEHYALYFDDRAAVVALHEVSNAVFVEQAAAIENLTARMTELSAGIDADYANYNAGFDTLNADIASFNSRAQSGGFSNQSEFDAERAVLTQRQNDLIALYDSIDARVVEYNDLLTQLEALNATSAELNESINITPRSESGL